MRGEKKSFYVNWIELHLSGSTNCIKGKSTCTKLGLQLPNIPGPLVLFDCFEVIEGPSVLSVHQDGLFFLLKLIKYYSMKNVLN